MQALIEVARAEEETAVKNDSASQLRAETLRGHDRARFWLREVGHHARAVRGDQIAAVIARRIVEQTMMLQDLEILGADRAHAKFVEAIEHRRRQSRRITMALTNQIRKSSVGEKVGPY